MTQEENDDNSDVWPSSPRVCDTGGKCDNSDGYSGHPHLEYVTQEENDDKSDGYSGHPHLEYVTQEENDDNSDGYSGHPDLSSPHLFISCSPHRHRCLKSF